MVISLVISILGSLIDELKINNQIIRNVILSHTFKVTLFKLHSAFVNTDTFIVKEMHVSQMQSSVIFLLILLF
jgi:hypothetical protein